MAATVLVTGGQGFLGRRVAAAATAAGWDVIAPPSGALDVRSAAALDDLLASRPVDAVAHLAYRRNERDTIVDGSANVAHAASRHRARLVHLSTDVVFAGRTAPYTEAVPTDPVEPYGQAKADAERAVRRADPSAALLRTSLLIGDPDDPGHAVGDVLGAVASGFRFFTDEIRSPVRVDDVATAVLALLGELRDVTGPLHLGGPEPLSRLDLARRVARRHGLDPESLGATTHAQAGVAGRRPGQVVLDSSLAASLGLRAGPVTG